MTEDSPKVFATSVTIEGGRNVEFCITRLGSGSGKGVGLIVRQLDHVALHVVDVQASVSFYRDVLCLPVMPRPAFDFPGAWFRLGDSQELHLIGDRNQPVHSGHRGTHFALVVEDLDEWERQLDSHQATRLPRRTRPDGAQQTFVQDPDGHWVELCVPKAH